MAADAKQGIELLQQRRATYAELGPAWPESVTEVLGQAVTLQEQIADLKQQLSATYSDAIESLDTDLLLREWKEAEESFWPKSWFGKRRIAALLVPTQSTAGEADHGKDLATWLRFAPYAGPLMNWSQGTSVLLFGKVLNLILCCSRLPSSSKKPSGFRKPTLTGSMMDFSWSSRAS